MSFMDPDQRQAWAEQAQKQRDRHGRQCGYNGARCPDIEEHRRLFGRPVEDPASTTPTVSSPRDIEVRRAASLTPDIDRLIRAIEAELLVRDGDVWIGTAGYKPGAVTSVAEKYRAAGWKVDIVTDGRDGNALVVKP
jgi:hypothetical protein